MLPWSVSINCSSRIVELEARALQRPRIDREALLALAHDLPAAWNAPSTDTRTKQRLTRILDSRSRH